MRIFSLPFLVAAYLLATGSANARNDFSADTVLHTAQGQTLEGRMIVSQGRVRIEYEQNGQRVVRINDPANDRIWTLFPALKQFSVQDVPPGSLSVGLGGQGRRSPCISMPQASCVDLGVEEIDGRAARKWEVTMTREGRSMSMTQWVDEQRGFPLRQDFGGGNGAELDFVGADEVNGRQVEKWRLTVRRGDQVRIDTQWYDPELETTIKEAKYDGSSRELVGIQVGPPDQVLFQVPQGYSQRDAISGGR
ncbi:MAG: hypothetical protein H6981_13050 [Gammaproteobacteria bacterium]|nr:hypothetical protein [Gammaproteobacteria bacterium]MCP5137716.1 hypothetical protein [Gammaproteobacteria bacterium]